MTFLNLPINPFFYKFSYNFFCKFFSYNLPKSLNIYKLNLIKKIKKNYEKKASEIYQSLSKKEKEKKQQYGCEEKILVEYRKKALSNESKLVFIIAKD